MEYFLKVIHIKLIDIKWNQMPNEAINNSII